MHVQVHMHKGKGGGEGSSTGACRYLYLIGKLQEIIYKSTCSADTTKLVSCFHLASPLPLQEPCNIFVPQGICIMAEWLSSQQRSVVEQCRCSRVRVPQHANYFGLDQIGFDWIVLHTNENTESMVKGRIDPSALPNPRRINPTSVIMCLKRHNVTILSAYLTHIWTALQFSEKLYVSCGQYIPPW